MQTFVVYYIGLFVCVCLFAAVKPSIPGKVLGNTQPMFIKSCVLESDYNKK